MIPINLHIRGFLSYKDPVDIDFEGLHLACITGPNGAGKSSILDSITWALFGAARARNDQVVNQLSDTAVVSLDFQYENLKYRIRRTKQIEKTMVLEFYVLDSEKNEWRSLTEHSMGETQKRILSTLRMDYNTFINASFFLQGKADQFTQLSPGERKEILSNILGLEIWEEYLQTTREIRKNLEGELKSISLVLENIKTEISKEDTWKDALAKEEQQLEIKRIQKDQHNKILNQAIQLTNAKEKIINQISQIETDISKLKKSLDTKKERYVKLSEEKSGYQQYLDNSIIIEGRFTRWQSIRIEVDDWNNKLSQYHSFKNKLTEVNHKIENHLSSLNNKKENFEKRLAEVEQFRQQLPTLQNDLTILLLNQEELSKSIGKKQTLSNEKLKIQKDISEKQLSINHLTDLNNEKRQKLIEFRGAGPDCPFCMQPLSHEHREKYEALVIEEGVERKKLINQFKDEIDSLKQSIKETEEKLQQIEKDEITLNNLLPSISEKKVQLSNIQKAIKDWNEKDDVEYVLTLEKIENQKDLQPFLQEKEVLENEIASLNYDELFHNTLKQSEVELRSVEMEYQQLITAKSKIDTIIEQLGNLENEIIDQEKELQEKESLLKSLNDEFSNQYSDLSDVNQIRKELDELDKEISLINTRIGGEKQKLDTISNKKIERKNYEDTIAKMLVSINRIRKIEDAFGKNGVPALLIEQALPEIEMHANELLERLSNGQLSIHFETQSEYKDKKRSDKKETLEILINDAYGHTRAYEMFSGGEAFRINFAIRLALSQVLAKRSGAKLETLVIDEGFGSQDSTGRGRLIETINLIKKDFAKLLIITHLEELKEVFPARIEVEKTINGSKVDVMVY